MSFRDEYKEAVDQIVPDKEFLDELSGKMKAEQKMEKKTYPKALMAAACICLCVLIGFGVRYVRMRTSDDLEPMQVNTGNTLQNSTAEPNLFDTSKWYRVEDGAEKIFSDFVKRLQEDGEWEAVYKNTENHFTDDMLLSQKEVHDLAQRIQGAGVLADKPDDIGEETYFMAEFGNGDIIKFVLSDDGYFFFLDLDYVYKI